jgi:bifunctional non-homologous end joining protein LigD
MIVSKYHQKRKFDSTREPKGELQQAGNALIFVVQQHAASHLHYDFRLEMEGVLKSWAIPKGPSMNPDDKRLAVMVEDHPYDYKDFEGNIPKGNYGAGNVIVWDKGTYIPADDSKKEASEKILLAGLKKGHLSIILQGEKLKGVFSLVKMHGDQDNAWLLMKKTDSFATDKDILKKDKSVNSGETLKSLETRYKSGKSAVKENKKEQLETAEFIAPMLAETATKPFDDQLWVFENKYDGYRTIAVINSDKVNLFSRNGLSFDKKFKTIAEELKKISHTAVLDGEVVIEDDSGRSDFQLLQNNLKTGKGTLSYYVFDLLNLDGQDIRSLKLSERKELLKMLLNKSTLSNVLYSEHVTAEGKSFFDLAKTNQQEGIMAKKSDSPYRAGKRSSEWMKIKITRSEEAVIVGITEPRGSRRYFGAILLARYDGENLIYAGKCGTGFDFRSLKDLYSKFESAFTNESPLNKAVKVREKVQWIKPVFVCQVKFTEWTNDNHLRHPVFMGLRADKKAEDVKVTTPIEIPDMKEKASPARKSHKYKNESDLKIGRVNVHLTNQNKIYFPEDSISKGDLIAYYEQVAEIILPYLKDRPQSLNRFPNGIYGKSFYHKDMDVERIPSWLKTYKTYSESNNADIDYLLCNNKASLLYMVNLGCIDINPWNSSIKHITKPDWVVIDLDPEEIDFKEVVRTALVVKEVLDELKIDAYCKTSGATGLHIYVPLAAKYDYEAVKIFAELISHSVNSRLPETTSILRPVKKRKHRVYIDFLQNRIAQTLAAPYSVRPKPGATVSTPLEWSEVNEDLSPQMFTIKNALQRFAQKGDLWKPVLGKGANLEKLFEKKKI